MVMLVIVKTVSK